MTGTGLVAGAAALFVGTHLLMSHPLRRSLVGTLGDRGFLGLYSLVAFVTLGLMIWAYRAAPVTAPLWPVGDGSWAIATALMLAASMLLMGSLVRNPALPDLTGRAAMPEAARGVYAITRHPMLWSFAIWGGCHVLVYPVGKNIAVALAIIVLSLVGAAAQDRKKERLMPDAWPGWERKTSFLPFAAIAGGRARFGGFGAHTLAGGTVVWLAATWAHIPLAGWAAGIWRWLG